MCGCMYIKSNFMCLMIRISHGTGKKQSVLFYKYVKIGGKTKHIRLRIKIVKLKHSTTSTFHQQETSVGRQKTFT